MDSAVVSWLAIHAGALMAVIGFLWRVARNAVTKRDLAELHKEMCEKMSVVHHRIDERTESVEFVQVIRRLDEKMDLLGKDHERMAADMRELRHLMEQLLQQRASGA